MITKKTKQDIEKLRVGGKRLATVLEKVSKKVAPGVTTGELDSYARELISEYGDVPAFLNYTPEGASFPYPAALCVSINDEVVHGIPGNRVIREGDIVSIDCGIKHDGLFTDSARTVIVGSGTKKEHLMLETAWRALEAGIAQARVGNKTGDIGAAIEAVIRPHGFGIIRDLAGHGVGHKIHEDPFIPNYGKKGTGTKLEAGMVVALEPMITLGGEDVIVASDGYTLKTRDGSRAVHTEHTIVITDGDPEILTV